MSVALRLGNWDCHLHVFDASVPVLAGTYTPQSAALSDLIPLASANGVERFVLVQPSVYGRDNQVMLKALRDSGGRNRGVAVVDASVSENELETMHALGVRGIRFNRVSPVGRHADPADELKRLAPRLRALGWHVQWFVEPEGLADLAALQAACQLPFVLDHLAGLHAKLPNDDKAWSHLERLIDGGQTWVKLSAWYRLQAIAPYQAIDATLQRIVRLFRGRHLERMVWGSDWPHTGISADQLPDYAGLLQPLSRLFSAPELDELLRVSPTKLYA